MSKDLIAKSESETLELKVWMAYMYMYLLFCCIKTSLLTGMFALTSNGWINNSGEKYLHFEVIWGTYGTNRIAYCWPVMFP